MCDFSGKRFNDRILDKTDDGAAFERFVDEFLRLQNPESGLVRGLAKGADGAIDLANGCGKITQIVECKFIGTTEKSGVVERRWREVSKHLSDNLPPLAKGDTAKRKNYLPWLKSHGDLKSYIFATSSIPVSTEERKRLEKSICDFFVQLSEEHDELSHLKNLHVEVRYWDDFAGKAAEFPSLFYRWFGGWPFGYGPIRPDSASQVNFKSFLDSSHLPYFGFDDFVSETAGKGISPFDKALEYLTGGNDVRVQIISGPGGIGKTRFSIELCEAACKRGWWPVRLERTAKADDLGKLCRSHSGSSRLLLFVDYAESFKDLEQLASVMEQIAREGNHRLALVASTRSSSIQKVKEQLSYLDLKETDIRAVAKSDFNPWLVRKILNHFHIPDGERIAQACSGLPVMAAFAGFLFKQGGEQFEKQFGILAAVKDFAGWSDRRLKVIEERVGSSRSDFLLADLAVRLPMTESEAYEYRDASEEQSNLFAALKADHWIELEENIYSIAHDVFSDAILRRYFSAMKGDEQHRLEKLVQHALNEDRLDRLLVAVDRLAEHPVFEKFSGYKLLKACLTYQKKQTLSALLRFVRSRLFPPTELIRIWDEEPVRAWLKEHAALPGAWFFYGSWLNAGGDIEVVREPVRAWLEEHAASPEAWSVYSSWLVAGGDIEVVRESVRAWLKEHAASPRASLIYGSWFEAGGDKEEVEEPVRAWLEEHAASPEAWLVYGSWLDAGGDIEVVREAVRAWLEEHAASPRASLIYGSWLDAGGDIEVVREPVRAWLEEHAASPEAWFFYGSWFEAGGDKEEVEEPVRAWLEEHAASPEAWLVYGSWLDAGGDIEVVREAVRAWLEEHAASPRASLIYGSWLDAGGDIEVVREPVRAWLEEHAASPEAWFFYGSWLVAGGDIEVVREPVRAWLEEHAASPKAWSVYGSWLVAGGDIEVVREPVKVWLGKYAASPEAQYVYESWCKRETGHPGD